MSRSLPDRYFEALYERDPDPWRLQGSEYERRKYDATMASLPRQRFASALEVGCSIGLLTLRLAAVCDRLLAVDVARAALRVAAETCAGCANVAFACRRVPEQWPEGTFDLIVLSEMLYFLDAADIDLVAARAMASLRPNGAMVLVHWRGETEYPTSGDAAAERFIAAVPGAVSAQGDARYRIDVVSKPSFSEEKEAKRL